MQINYILSDTNNSATSLALKQVTKKAEEDVFSNVLVLVPEPKSIAVERELLDNSKKGAFANIFVYSFVRLLSRIGGIEKTELVSKQTCVMILRKIILDNLEKLSCYQRTARTVGFAEKIYDTIQQFKSSSYTLEDVKSLAEKSSGALKSKMIDIAFLFEEYEKELENGFFDDCDRLRKLGELAKTSEFLKNADIFVVEFDNVTPDMLEVLKELAINSKSITFSSVYFNEKRKDKYIQNNELYHKYISIATKLKYPYNPIFVNSAYKGDFWNIHNYVYSTEKKETQSAGNVHVFELDNKQSELDFVANQILTEVKQGKRFKDIAVIDTDFEKDIQGISKVFDDYEIPYFITKSYDISSHFFVLFIKNSIDVIISKFSAEKVLKWLSSPLIELDGYGEFLNYVKEFGVNWSGFLTGVSTDLIKNEERVNKINQVVDFIVSFSDKFKNDYSKEDTISHYISSIEKIVEFVDAQNKLEKIAKFEKENLLVIDAEVTSVIFEKFNDLNANLNKFLGSKVVSPVEFLQIYLSGFSEEEVNLVPVSVDCVMVQKNTDGLYKIKDLFIVGAVENNFPIKMTDTGILQDHELDETLKLSDKMVEPTIKSINSREKFGVFEMLLLPSEKLFISYANKSFGSVNKPATVVNRIVKLLSLEIEKKYKINELITQKIAEKHFAKNVSNYLLGGNISQAQINEDYNQIKNYFSKNFADVIGNLTFGNKEFYIKQAKEIYFTNNTTSVSQLETYFSCPYKFFAKYGLKLKDNKDASLSSLDIGTIVHKFAELVTKNIDSFNKLSGEEFNLKARELLTEALGLLDINKTKNTAIISFIGDESVRLAKYLFFEQQNSSFKNDAKLNEFSFYGSNAVKLQVNDDTIISIEGKIDRIDKFGDYIRIIDYKTGETESDLESIYFGKKIQLVSYLSASQKIGNQKIAGLFYFPIHSDFVKFEQKSKNNYKMQGFLLDDIEVIKYMDSTISFEKSESDFVPLKISTNAKCRQTGELKINYGRSNNFYTEEEFENIKTYTEKLCTNAVGEILSGNIEPSPVAKLTDKDSSVCMYCELNGFCGKEHAKFGKARRCGGDVTSMSFEQKENRNGN